MMSICLLMNGLILINGSPIDDVDAKDETKLLVISEDIIPDIENTTQKVIRVNPLDLPPVKDGSNDTMESSLFQIKSLTPAERKYINSKSLRRQKAAAISTKRPELSMSRRSPPEPKYLKPKHQQKKQKKFKFLYPNDEEVNEVASETNLEKEVKVQVSPGEYPIFYTVAKVNGKFGKFPIKSFRNLAEFRKYLIKSKQEPIPMSQRYWY